MSAHSPDCLIAKQGGKRCAIGQCLQQTRCKEKKKAMARMSAVLKASARVRDGRWVRGAPTHVLAEFVTELEKEGWEIRKRA